MSGPSIIDVPWIGAVDLAGRWQRVSARQILSDPGAWGALHENYPMRTVAAWRLVTALHLAATSTGANIGDYADQWYERLAIRGVPRPFGQHPDLAEVLAYKREKGEGRMVELDPLRASGNAPLLWDHTTADQDPPYSEAEAVAAMLLLATAGAGGTSSGMLRVHPKTQKLVSEKFRFPAPGPHMADIAVIPYAGTVKTVLEAITQHFRPDEHDRPAWEWPEDVFEPVRVATVKTPAGVLEWLTWPTRAVWIDWDGPTAIGAVSTPGWKADPQWARAEHDPFALPDTNPKRLGGVVQEFSLGAAARELRAWHMQTTTSEPTATTGKKKSPTVRPLPPHFNQMRHDGLLRLHLLAQQSSQKTQINGHEFEDLIFTALNEPLVGEEAAT